MAEVLEFARRKPAAAQRAPEVRDDDAYVHGCGSFSFWLHRDGTICCRGCNDVLQTKRWFIP